jgi:hypothetical protein
MTDEPLLATEPSLEHVLPTELARWEPDFALQPKAAALPLPTELVSVGAMILHHVTPDDSTSPSNRR